MPTVNLHLQHREAPRLQALVAILRAEVGALRTDIAALMTQERLASAAGEHLDRWGALVGQARRGLSDGDYRRVLTAALLAYRSRGVPARIVAAAGVLMGVTPRYIRRGTASYRLIFDTTGGNALPLLFLAVAQPILDAMAPAGVAATAVEDRGFRLDTAKVFDGTPLGRRIDGGAL